MNRIKGLVTMGLAVVVATLAAWEPALAQCPMCKQSIEASTEGASMAGGINLAVLVLLIPAVLIFAGIFGAVYKYRDEGKDDQPG
ncbi:MAG TPA: hypothetical protein VJH03_14045 [Blastocatellia bacterium]|nr:hypothetical protein [Blastocatellia bacterium]